MRKLFIILAAVACVVGFTVSALAADWAFYGRAMMDTYWQSTDKETSTKMNFDDSDLYWELDDGSYVGANISTDYGIGAKWEYGNNPDKADLVSLRLLFGTWNFGAGTLLVGQDYQPTFYGCGECNQVPVFLSHGLYTGRKPQLKLTMGGLQVALIENGAINGGSTTVWDNTGTAIATFDDTDVSLPKIEARYNLNVGPASVSLIGGYQTFDQVVQTATTETEYSVDSWVVGLGANVGFGPAKIQGALSMSQNPSNYGLAHLQKAYPVLDGNNMYDVETLSWFIDVAYAVSDTVRVDAGYGQGKHEIDIQGVTVEENFGTYHIFANFTLAKGMSIQPEYSVKDYGDEIRETSDPAVDEGKITYVGLRWYISW